MPILSQFRRMTLGGACTAMCALLTVASALAPAAEAAPVYNLVYAFKGGTTDGYAPSPRLTVLHAFNTTDGADPTCRLAQDSAGILYGTTLSGGKQGAGTVFSLTPPAPGRTAWQFTSIWQFNSGGAPVGGVVIDSAGNLYGAGSAGLGSVFRLTPPAKGQTAWTETTLWIFKGGTGDGGNPSGGLTMGPDGTLYGTTAFDGPSGTGTVFSLSPPTGGGTSWTEQLIWTFPNGTTGAAPAASLTLAADGTLYGTSGQGGANANGTVFQLAPPSSGQSAWTGTLLYSFPAGDLAQTFAEVTLAADGSLFGTTVLGGNKHHGSVFHLTPAGGGAWHYATIWHGARKTDFIVGGVALSPAGDLFGVGGSLGDGALFELTPPANGQLWAASLLARFGRHTGEAPRATPTLAANGVVYGTTEADGPGGAGTVFSLTQ